MQHNPLICAIDTPDLAHAQRLCASLEGCVGAVKLGLEFFTAHGASGVKQVMAGRATPLFLDLKFHDIPNTVAGAVRSTAGMGAAMLTVHASGGEPMLRAAMEASHAVHAATGKRPLILAVTVLTSMDAADLAAVGIERAPADQVLRLAELAQAAGIDGLVCSPHEIAPLRRQCGNDLLLVVPGIRPEGASNGDQKRVMTPKEALAAGADYLVIGRPITGAANPTEAAREIVTQAA